MSKTKTWIEKRDGAPAAHVEILEKPFGGVPAGAKLLISSPKDIAAYLHLIPKGETREIAEMREALAVRAKADAACPMTTSLFLRIVAEAALEEMSAGKKAKDVAPFWRIVAPGSPIALRLPIGDAELTALRSMDGIAEA
jgi:hypothetical protein